LPRSAIRRSDAAAHWDIGILKPEKSGENGYGYYTPSQFFDFYLISSLKPAGSPLSEIRRYLENPDAREFLQILYRQRRNLQREKLLLERMEQLVSQSIGNIELALSVENEFRKPSLKIAGRVFHRDRAPDIRTKLSLNISTLQDHSITVLRTISRGISDRRDRAEGLSSRLLDHADYFCSRLFKPCRCDRLHIKPAACMPACCIKVRRIRAGGPQLMTYISYNGYPCADMLQRELAGFLSTARQKLHLPHILQVTGPRRL
jgi:DNA-binding transcriptional MerR regulator